MDDLDRLGGRLELLPVDQLDEDQARYRDRLVASRGAEAVAAGFEMVLPDGRLIGPFNALVRVPGIAQALRAWAAEIARYDLPADVQQVAILTVGATWNSDYEVYAHAAEAAHVGVPQAAIEAIRAGHAPAGLSEPAQVAYRLACALTVEHAVSDELYAQAQSAFGTEKLIALVNVIGRYMSTAAVLATFRVPVP
jgi:4-carboxymuconolactone decarboxylase